MILYQIFSYFPVNRVQLSPTPGTLTPVQFTPPATGNTEAPTAAQRGCGATVCISGVDVSRESAEGLRALLRDIGRSEAKLAGLKSQVLAEIARRDSDGAATRVAKRQLRTSRHHAKHDVEAARRLAELPSTADALNCGDIPPGHARLIARASSEGPINEQALVEAAKTQGYDEFAKTVRRQQHELSADDGQALLDRQREKRTGRMFQSRESGMFVLSAE